MSEILRKWLSLKLGFIIDYKLTCFEELAQDGTLLAKILHNYGIINETNLHTVSQSTDPETCYSNYIYLRNWLRAIGVQCSEQDIYKIAHAEKSAAIKLFYQLYIVLNTTSKINYLVTKNMQVISEQDNESIDLQYNACRINEISTAHDIDDTRKVLSWYKNKYEEVLSRCNKARQSYNLKMIEEQAKEVEDKKKSNVTDQLMGFDVQSKKFKNQFKSRENHKMDEHERRKSVKIKKKTEEYINYLQQKEQKTLANKKKQKVMEKILLTELLNSLMKKEDMEVQQFLTEKLLRQSNYEKQVSTKLLAIHHQKDVMLENLRNEYNKINDEKNRDFYNQLVQQKSNLSLQTEIYYENKKRQMELHNRLWKERCETKYKEDYQKCTEIIEDIADLAIKYSEYRNLFKNEPTKLVQQEWAQLFVTSQPIFDVIEDITEVLTDPQCFDEPLTIEYYRQSKLDEEDFQDYHHLLSAWALSEAINFYDENEEVIRPGLNILGFIINRLLLLKYPCPPPHPTPNLPPTDVRAALVGVHNNEIISYLQEGLKKYHIAVIDIPTVINHYVEAYKLECPEKEVDKTMVQATEIKKSKQDKSKDKTKSKKDKKKDKKEKPEKKKGKKKTPGEDKPIKFAVIEVETQTSEIVVIPQALSKKAELGKMAFDSMNLGLELNEMTIIDMLADFLEEFPYLKG